MKRTTKQLSAAMAIAALTTTTFVTHADTITVTTETNQKQVVAGIGAGAWGLGGTFAKSNYGGIDIGGNAKSQIGQVQNIVICQVKVQTLGLLAT